MTQNALNLTYNRISDFMVQPIGYKPKNVTKATEIRVPVKIDKSIKGCSGGVIKLIQASQGCKKSRHHEAP